MTLGAYVERLEAVVEASTNREARWITEITSLAKRKRAYGSKAQIEQWMVDRGLRRREVPLPA